MWWRCLSSSVAHAMQLSVGCSLVASLVAQQVQKRCSTSSSRCMCSCYSTLVLWPSYREERVTPSLLQQISYRQLTHSVSILQETLVLLHVTPSLLVRQLREKESITLSVVQLLGHVPVEILDALLNLCSCEQLRSQLARTQLLAQTWKTFKHVAVI